MNSADCTILISTSPIPSHPDTAIIDEIVASARFHLPESPIVIMADGIWSKLAHRREQYEEYLRRLQGRYSNIIIKIFHEHSSQAKMTWMTLLADIKTKYILFNEHDISLRTDIRINWDAIFNVLEVDYCDVVRLTGFSEGIHPEHLYLTYGNGASEFWHGLFWKTHQWSQWPHISTKDFYLRMFQQYFNPYKIEMIEEHMHGICQTPEGGRIRIWQYLPDGDDKRCFTHLEGRRDKNGIKDPCHWET